MKKGAARQPRREAGQDRFAHDGDRRLRLAGLVVVARGDDDDQAKAGYDEEALAAIAEGADPGLVPLRRSRDDGKPAPIPLIAITSEVGAGIRDDMRAEGVREPVRRDDAAPVMDAAVEDQPADACEVARRHPQPRSG